MIKADLAKRLVAGIIDAMVISFFSNLISIPISFCSIFALVPLMAIDNEGSEALNAASFSSFLLLLCIISIVSILISFILIYVYYMWLPVKKMEGATVGKKVMNITVVKTNGQPVTQMDLFVREIIGSFISLAVFGLGYIWILFDERGQGWHDKIADTLVVEVEQKPKPVLL